MWEFLRRVRVPVLGVCYGLQELTHGLGGTVERAEKREFGHADVTREAAAALPPSMVDIFADLPAAIKVWMSHGDKLTKLAPGMAVVATSPNCEYAAVAGSVGV